MLINKLSYSSPRLVVISIFLLAACANTQKGKLLEYGLIGGLIGGAVGAQKPTMKEANMTLSAAEGALLGVTIATLFDDTDNKVKDLEAKVKFLEDLGPVTTKSSDSSSLASSQTHSQGSTQSNIEEVPEEFRSLLESNHYELFKINRWTRRGPSYLVKESELIKLNGKR